MIRTAHYTMWFMKRLAELEGHVGIVVDNEVAERGFMLSIILNLPVAKMDYGVIICPVSTNFTQPDVIIWDESFSYMTPSNRIWWDAAVVPYLKPKTLIHAFK